jgi:sugar phosphate isomerase/epimerase
MGGGSPNSNPRAVIYAVEAIKCARNLGANVVLLALLRRGFPATDEEYERVILALKEVAPYAAEDGIALGLECSGSADDQLRIIKGVDHPAVMIYYDVYNAMHFGFAPLQEIPKLGDTICEFHIKNGRNRMRVNIEGMDHPRISGAKIENFNHPALAAAIKATGYKGWLTLESPILSDEPLEDVRDNVAYVREVYQMPDA